nr:MAG TPA: hypothetical protein [Caudoviricetes sp.]
MISGDDATATQGHERGHSGKWQSITGVILPSGFDNAPHIAQR